MTASIDEPGLETRVAEVLNRWPVAGLAVGVVRGGSLAWFHGHGVADISSGTPVGPDTVFRIASVTKTITAVAVMPRGPSGVAAVMTADQFAAYMEKRLTVYAEIEVLDRAGMEVRLRYAFFITCREAVRNAKGELTELRGKRSLPASGVSSGIFRARTIFGISNGMFPVSSIGWIRAC